MALGVAHEDKWIVEEDREGEKGRGRGRGRLEKVRVEGEEHRCFREFILYGRATFSYIPNAGRLTITLGVALVKRQFLLLLCSNAEGEKDHPSSSRRRMVVSTTSACSIITAYDDNDDD